MKKFVPLSALLLLFSSSPSLAMMMSEQCKDEIHKICPMKAKDKDHEKMKTCIDKNASKISKECYQEVSNMRACKGEVEKYCPMSKKEKSEGGMMKTKECVDKNLSKLSQNCQVLVQKFREEMRAKIAACGADVIKFCSDIKIGDHKGVKKCLEKNEDELSDECKATRESGMM